MKHVQQKHSQGCLVAALAIVLGLEYDEALSILEPSGNEPDWRHGFTFVDFDNALVERGWAVARKFRWLRGNIERQPWPPAPWANVHLALVRCTENTSHAVILLRDGTVMDPLASSPRKLTDYVSVDNVAALTPLTT